MEKFTPQNDAIDFVHLLKVLLKRKWFIIGGTLLLSLAAGIIAFFLPKSYTSRGFFQLSIGTELNLEELKDIQQRIKDNLARNFLNPDTVKRSDLVSEILHETSFMKRNVAIPEYKTFLSQFTNPQRFIDFLESQKLAPQFLASIKNTTFTSEDIEQWITPIYAYSKTDVKELVRYTKDLRNFVMGIIINGEQGTPEQAQQFIKIMGGFIKNSILRDKLTVYIDSELNRCRMDAKKYENLIIEDEFRLKQLKNKRDDIKKVLETYPKAKGINSGELYSLANSGYRYLPPVTQLVGLESYLADIKENLCYNERDRQIFVLKGEFLAQLQQLMEKEKLWEKLLPEMIKLTDSFFIEKTFPPDVVRQVKNESAMDVDGFVALSDIMRFSAEPTLPEFPVKPKKVVILTASMVFAFFFFIFLAFFLEWWKTNKEKIDA